MHLGMPVVPDEYITKRGWLKGTCSNFNSDPSCPLMKSSKKTLQQKEKWSDLFYWLLPWTDQFGIPDISMSFLPQNGERTTFFKSGRPAHIQTGQSHNHRSSVAIIYMPATTLDSFSMWSWIFEL